ncbi:Ig-like domain-containing protein, partial [Flavobacteriaceae bacterium]|nr:Ig-like domain-containing protein [Flavobacteriaceae bacterium]
SVSLSSDGTTVAIGATGNDRNGSDSGHVRIYNYNGSSWTQLGEDIYGEAASDYSGNSVSLSSDGTTVAIGATGNDSNGSNSGQVRVYNLVIVNKKPIAVADTKTVEEDSSLTSIDVITNDTDEDGDDLSLVAVNSSGTGTLALNSDGLSVDYTPQINFNGTEVITYTVSDGFSNVDGTLTITVNPVNDPVIASNVSAATLKNSKAIIHLVASDIDFDDLTYNIVSQPTAGAVSLNGDIATYTPATNVSGTVTFTFKANDGTLDSDIKTVTIKIIEGYLSSFNQIGSDIDGEAEGDQSGGSISFNEDATIMAIGAAYNDGNGTDSGHVRVYKHSVDSWTQIGEDIDGEAATDWSGRSSISLSSDGTIVAIGASGNDDSGSYAGHVRIYNYNGTAWNQLGADIDGDAAGDISGSSVSLSSDGKTVAIGSSESDQNGENSGLVKIYNYNGSSWTQLGNEINGQSAIDNSGYSVSLSSNGTVVAIGAPLNNGNGAQSGHVRIYSYNGSNWTQLGTDIDGEAAIDQSGYSVFLSSNGKRVAIGANKNDGNGTDSGHVRIYNYNGTSWIQIGSDIDGDAAGDFSGHSISLSSDGNTLAIGTPYNDGNGTDSGHVKIYSYNGNSWTQLGADIDGEAASDNSGWSVSLSSDGTSVAIGASANDGNGTGSGHVRVYDLVNLKSINLDNDRDGDTILDDDDNCPDVSNINQEDMDGDGIGDV